MAHDRRFLKNEEQIEALTHQLPAWITVLLRPAPPAIIPTFRRLNSSGEDMTDILAKMLGFAELDIPKLYDEQIVYQTAPFTEPQVEAIHSDGRRGESQA